MNRGEDLDLRSLVLDLRSWVFDLRCLTSYLINNKMPGGHLRDRKRSSKFQSSEVQRPNFKAQNSKSKVQRPKT
jgi:hypothetical protein